MLGAVQSLESAMPKLEYLLSSNPNRSLSGVFKALRKLSSINLIGDYLLLYFIIKYGFYRSPQFVWNRSQVLRAVRVSGFYLDEGRKQAYIPTEWEEFIKDGKKQN